MKKQILSFVMALAFASDINAQETIQTSGSCAKTNTNGTCEWSFDTLTNTLRITGSGKMESYSSNPPWFAYQDQIKEITIEDGITSIGNRAFYAASNLETVNIPNSVEQIGDWAFCRTQNLKEIKLPNNPNFTTIPDYAFSHSGLTSIDIPQNVTSIGDWAFSGCKNLTNILISDNVNFIDHGAFNALPQDVNVYCRQGTNKHNGKTCDELIDDHSLFTGKSTTYQTDDNGFLMIRQKKYASFKDFVEGNYIKKRIYTIEEAAAVSKPTGNTFKIRYK